MNTELSILFIPLSINLKSGSYRIWINDYNDYFNKIGVNSKIIEYPKLTHNDIKSADIVILGKSIGRHLNDAFNAIKKIKNSILVGTITPPRDLMTPFDFVMAGSLEEYDSLSFHKNVILNAHIESLYHDSKIKTHKKEEKLKICYHGWTPHLYSFSCGLKDALEKFNHFNKQIELHVITEHTEASIDWDCIKGKPAIDVVFKKWNIDTVKQDIQACDIGICPGVYDLTSNEKNIDKRSGKFNTDYIVRYKNKTNNGRAIVFMQLGLPVIADFSPSNFHLFGDQTCGLVAHTSTGWYKSLLQYNNHVERNKKSVNAKKFINEKYEPLSWAQNYYNKLVKIKEGRK
jgi:hypothetical protein